MRYTMNTRTGPVEVDMVELTVGNGPGYRLTVPGYATVALFERDGRWWKVAISTPGRMYTKRGKLDSQLTTDVVRIYGGRMLVDYIDEHAIPLRTGKLPKSTDPVDRDAKWRTPPTHRRAGKYRDKWRKNHRGPLGVAWDFVVDVLLD